MKTSKANNTYINYIEPLARLKILNIGSLHQESHYRGSYKNFAKILTNLESKQVIESMTCCLDRRKYYFLTDKGGSYFDGDKKPFSVNIQTFEHDLKVVDLTRHFMDLGIFDEFKLEHDIKRKNSLAVVCPDALFTKSESDPKFRCALELELNFKSKRVYLEKIKEYINNGYYDIVIYFFERLNILRAYQKSIENEFGKEAFNKISFAYNPYLFDRKFNFNDSKIIFTTKEIPIAKFFKK